MSSAFTLLCSNCGKRLKVDSKLIGRTGKCPSCGNSLVIERKSEGSEIDGNAKFNLNEIIKGDQKERARPERPAYKEVSQLEYTPSSRREGKSAFQNAQPSQIEAIESDKKLEKSSTWHEKIQKMPDTKSYSKKALLLYVTGTGIASLVAGFFAGREYLKYEIRSAFSKIGDDFAKSFGKGPNEEGLFGNKAGEKIPPGQNPENGNNPDKDLPQVPIQTYKQMGKLAAGVLSAEIANAQLKSIGDDFGPSTEKYLIFTLKIKNTDDRKIFRYRDGSIFENYFNLVDDVDNRIKGVNTGIYDVKGSLKSGADIIPGAEVSHLVMFTVPPPKTKFLILIINMEAFSGENSFQVKIPVEAIQGWGKK